MERMNELHLFAGAGGGIIGGILLGHTCVCAVEIESYCRRVLLQRQRDGILPRFPIWDDVRTFDGKPWRGNVDIVCGGFPCQDISVAGKGAGIEGKRSGLWSEMARVVREVEPRFVFVENSPMLTSRGLGRVLGDLAEMGYDARWGVFGAIHVGSPHRRERIWIVANSKSANDKTCKNPERVSERTQLESGGSRCHIECWFCGHSNNSERGYCWWCQRWLHGNVSDSNSQGLEERESESGNNGKERKAAVGNDWWKSEPDVGRVVNGVASRVDRLKAIGNGQVPSVVALAWKTLTDDLP